MRSGVQQMEDLNEMWIPVIAIVGAFTYVIVQTLTRARIRELEVRERIAMIERGLVPPPEKDPTGFERAMHRFEDHDWDDRPRRSPSRYRSAGVTIMGVGFGLMLMIGVAAGEPEEGIGIGGFLVIIGLAFFLNSWLSRHDPPSTPPPAPPSPVSGRTPGV